MNNILNRSQYLHLLESKSTILTKDDVLQAAKDCKSRSEFKKVHRKEYEYALNNDILDEIDWFIFNDGRNRCVYTYVDEENKVAYVGLTVNIEERDKSHRTGYYHGLKKFSAVYEYFTSINKDVPQPNIVKDNLSIPEAQELEDKIKLQFIDDGYTVLNSGVTGLGSGSIGKLPKWTKEKIFAVSLDCSSPGEFQDKYERAYKLAYDNGWISEMYWLTPKKKSWKEYTDVYEEAKKYKKRSDFWKYSPGAAKKAKEEGWLDSFDWMPKLTGNWEDYDKVYQEAQKYNSSREFKDGNGAAYQSANKHDWLKDYDWFEKKRKECKTEEEALEIASQYKSRHDLKLGNRSAYAFLNGKGYNKTGEKLWDKVPHLQDKRKKSEI